MSALPKATHFDIADAWRAVPESHGRITRSCDGAAMWGKRCVLQRATTKRKGSKRFLIEILKQLTAMARCRRVEKGAL
jgi:hypothetical protein